MSSSSNLLRFYDEHSMLIVSPTGKLHKLLVPFKVICVVQTGSIPKGTSVYVDAVAWHQEHRILYYIFNEWQPYHYFRLAFKS